MIWLVSYHLIIKKVLNINYLHPIFTILVVALISMNLSAQSDSLQLHFEAYYEDHLITLEDTLYFKEKPITFTVIKYYLSNFHLLQNEEVIWTEENSHHLINVEDKESEYIHLNIPAKLNYDAIQFDLGIDSLTNVSGAMGGDLDPTKGMYWTWNSGYINFKLEGHSPLCTSRKNAFQYHLGGYLPPFQSIQTIQLKINQAEPIHIQLAIDKFLEEIDLSQAHSIMSPSKEAKKLSQAAAQIFNH